ncbi:MAG: fibronectin type III domain-containing protein [Acidimicrobiales bacterium]
MRRTLVILFALAAALGGVTVVAAPAGPAAAQALPVDPGLGLVFDGLRASAGNSLCGGAFESVIDAALSPGMKDVLCTHGPDPAPEGVDVRNERGPDPAAEVAFPLATGATAAETGAAPCYGNGTDGYRVQLVYARSTNGADRFATYSASFRSWAARMDQVVSASAEETGGTRHIRFVTDAACNPVVDRVTLSGGAMSSFSSMVSELHSLGYSRTDRKYLVWADANVYCGISELYVDDSPDPTPGRNYNNGNAWIQGAIGRVDNGCWGLAQLTEAHELLHLLGGVQPSAPNATPGFHCTDESDRLCYADGTTGAPVRQVCPAQNETLYDCNHDDYFHTSPPPGSYLSTHWNTAASAFLSGQAPEGPVTTTTTLPPPPTTTTPTTATTAPPATTTTTIPPPPTPTTTTTAAPPTTTPVAPVTTTTLGPPATTTTTAPSTGATPSAPQAVGARQPAVGSGVQLSWQAPANGPVTGYRVYRGTSPHSQTLQTSVPNVLGYNDASAGRTLYYYRVSAYNAAGEGPSSALTGMIGKAATPAGVVRDDVDRRLVVSDARLGSWWSRRWA